MLNLQDVSSNRLLPTSEDIEKVHDYIAGRCISSAVYTAAKFGIADLLVDSPKDYKFLARALKLHAKSLYRLMRALASIGIFEEIQPGVFYITSMASTLRSDIPNSMRDLIIMCGEKWHWLTWGDLDYTIKTGKSSFIKNYKIDFFSYMQQNPDVASGFNKAMSSLSSLSDTAVVEKYDFSCFNTIIDIGGGYGGLITAVLSKYKKVKGILCDLPNVIEAAKANIQSLEVGSRCELHGINFFKKIPPGGNLYILKHVLHGLSDTQSINLLKLIREQLQNDSKVIVIDMIVPQGNKPSYSKFNDLGMLLISETGSERTFQDFENIFNAAGLTINTIQDIQMGINIIEAKKLI